MLHRDTSPLMLLALAGLLAGCGDGTVASPEAEAFVTVTLVDGGGGDAAVRGTLSTTTRVDLWRDDRGWVPLGEARAVTLALQNEAGALALAENVAVPPGIYSRVRVVLEGARASLAAGSVLGGHVLTAATTVTLGRDGDLEVTKPVEPFEVGTSATIFVVVDLRSRRWLEGATASSPTALEEDVAAALEVSVR